MREIKFRVWDHDRGSYRFDWEYCFEEFGQCARLVYEQYTGLEDENGREIYDGDIVTAPWHWDRPHVIALPHDYYSFAEYAIGDELTVIGNIHENPEQLK